MPKTQSNPTTVSPYQARMDKPSGPIIRISSPKPKVAKPPQLRAPTPVGQTSKMVNMRPPWYRRKYLVYPKFQMTLIILNTVVTMALFGLISYLVIRSHLYLENLVKQTRLPAQNLFIQLLTEQLRSLLIYMFISLSVGLITTATLTLFLSHKMAGPMIRLKSFFSGISKGGEFPEPIRFREGDFFQELPPVINHAFQSLKKKWHR